MPSRKYVLTHKRAPGDVLVMTAFVRDLLKAYPDFKVDVSTPAMDVWKHNPYLKSLRLNRSTWQRDVNHLKLDYGRGIREQNYKTVHFIQYFHNDFEKKTGLKVPVTHPTPDLHLSDEEKNTRLVEEPYWLVISGGKSDFTAKVWHQHNFQAVVDGLKPHGVRFVQIGSADSGHWHPPLKNVLNLVGKTNLRDLFQLIYHSEGVLCGVTMAMHAAAALNRPCVVLAGGREAWWWEAYVNANTGFGPQANGKVPVPHRFLHTIGLLDCCKHHGCWRNKVVQMGKDKSLCKRPVFPTQSQPVPECLDLITPEHVMEAIMSYTDTSYPPVGKKPDAPSDVSKTEETPDEAPAPGPPKAKLVDPFATPGQKTPEITLPPPPKPPADVPTLKVSPKGRGPKHANKVAAAAPGMPAQAAPPAVVPADGDVFDHPTVGGKFTVFVLFYGPDKYYDMHKQCVDSILATIPANRMDLRVASNELNDRSTAYLESLKSQGKISLYYKHAGNERKYPVMREMFWDDSNPITTKWLMWFDDDTVCNRNPSWLTLLANQIIQHHPTGHHMFGAKYIYALSESQREFYKTRPWYKGKQFRTSKGHPAPNGSKVIFATGGFWALTTEAMRACNIPDPELGHNGGDYTIGEQLYQGGYKLKQWNGRKQFVNTSSVPRRGLNEKHFGTT